MKSTNCLCLAPPHGMGRLIHAPQKSAREGMAEVWTMIGKAEFGTSGHATIAARFMTLATALVADAASRLRARSRHPRPNTRSAR
jgi:hypothetical protein